MFLRLTIGSRLKLLFLSTTLLTIASGFAAIVALRAMSDALAATKVGHRNQLLAHLLEAEIVAAIHTLDEYLAGEADALTEHAAFEQRINGRLGELKSATRDADERESVLALESVVSGYGLAVERIQYLRARKQEARLKKAVASIDETFVPELKTKVARLVAFQASQVELHELAAERGRRVATTLIYITLTVLAVMVVALFLLLRRWIVQPLEQLVDSARRISQGDYLTRIPKQRLDEIGVLAREMERMAASVEQYQRQLVEKERLAAMGEMTSAVAHNVRNPLASIRALAQSSSRALAAGAPGQEALAEIMRAVDRLDRWLKELLQTARPVRVESVLRDVNEMVREVADSMTEYAQQRDVELELRLDTSLSLAPIDRRRMDQALIALLSNAIEASSAGQRVVLTTRPSSAAPSRVEIEISDTGHGMATETLNKVFLPYFTTKKSGTGLGMSLAKRIIMGHQGLISLDSAPQKGCRVTVSLPLHNLKDPSLHGANTDR
ncbi:MAG: ATP-binding protein [Planctomycetota bacterium]